MPMQAVWHGANAAAAQYPFGKLGLALDIAIYLAHCCTPLPTKIFP